MWTVQMQLFCYCIIPDSAISQLLCTTTLCLYASGTFLCRQQVLFSTQLVMISLFICSRCKSIATKHEPSTHV